MRCVSRARTFCRAAPTARRSTESPWGEDVFVAKPTPRSRQQRARAIEPQRLVLEEPRQAFSGGGIERAQTQVLADAPLMCGDRLLPAGVGVDRLGVGAQLQGREPQDLPVDLQGRLSGESAEHTHEGDLVRETQPVVGTPPQGDLAAVGLEEGRLADQAGLNSSAAGNMTRSVSRICQIQVRNQPIANQGLVMSLRSRNLRPNWLN